MDIVENLDQWVETFESNWLAHYKETGGFNWKIYNRAKNSEAPGAAGIDLSKSRLMLISSAGSYLHDEQEVYDAAHDMGDASIRVYSSSTDLSQLSYAHTHYDHTAVNSDPQVLIPLQHLREMVDAGEIGELAPSVVSFGGYLPDIRLLLNETIPAIVEVALKEKVDGALLVPA